MAFGWSKKKKSCGRHITMLSHLFKLARGILKVKYASRSRNYDFMNYARQTYVLLARGILLRIHYSISILPGWQLNICQNTLRFPAWLLIFKQAWILDSDWSIHSNINLYRTLHIVCSISRIALLNKKLYVNSKVAHLHQMLDLVERGMQKRYIFVHIPLALRDNSYYLRVGLNPWLWLVDP